MIRKIINIDEEKCNGCGACAKACHEGAIEMKDGKARLMRDDYCDGLGDCLPKCPTGAITFVMREAAAYNEAEVKKNMERKEKEHGGGCACQGAKARAIKIDYKSGRAEIFQSALSQWPVQIKIVPTEAEYFNGCNLLIAADCSAYAYAAFHKDFIDKRVTLIGCPKLDDVDYTQKLCEIIEKNDIKSLTIVRMEVPCCGGIENAAKNALLKSGKFIPWQVFTISLDGRILN